MRLLRAVSADGRLRNRHERMEATGQRKPYLVEVYTNPRHVEIEAERLFRLGYRIESRQAIRGHAGFYYNVTFTYHAEQDLARAGKQRNSRLSDA